MLELAGGHELWAGWLLIGASNLLEDPQQTGNWRYVLVQDARLGNRSVSCICMMQKETGMPAIAVHMQAICLDNALASGSNTSLHNVCSCW